MRMEMVMSSQLHAPATSPQKESTVSNGYEAGWAPDLVWTWWQKRKKSLTLLGI